VASLNYNHLFYFWTVVREGGVSAASRVLRLAQPTVSEQVRALEAALEVPLFHRQRGKLVLTDAGAHAYRYADEIFALGRELEDTLAGRPGSRAGRLVVGLADEVPKLIAQRLLAPAQALPDGLRLVCYEDRQERLLADLATYALDLVLAEAPVGPASNVRAYSHLLGECGVTLFAKAPAAGRLRRGFPRSLDGAPFLMPIEGTIVRRGLTKWFESAGVRPRVCGEFQDSALLGVFGRAGAGAFPAPTAIEDEVRAQYGVEVIARLDDVRERFYAITVERRIKHPAVAAIAAQARADLFAAREGE
jgi:LysR family transcriptional activator of nhaA